MSAADTSEAVTLAETKQLYWFSDGTDADARQRLRRTWGLCPRHSWLLFGVEHELRYLPIDVATLYQDLTWHATVLLGRRQSVAQLRRALESPASCVTCDVLARGASEDRAFADGQARVAAASRVRRWTSDSRSVWQHHICPSCEIVQLPPPQHPQPCRLHVIENATQLRRADAVDHLARLGARLLRCVKSLSYDGPARTPDSDAALIEALGWFAGWQAGRRYLTPAE